MLSISQLLITPRNSLKFNKVLFSVVLLQDTDEDPVVIRNSGLTHRVTTDEGKDYVFTVKLFLARWDGKLVKQAVQASKAVDYPIGACDG